MRSKSAAAVNREEAAGEAIGKGDDNGGHALFADQPVEPFRQSLAGADPIRMG